jgi:protoporphyrinogen IX oxidase
MLWLKACHIIFMVTWFSALFYLPRLFVYHAMATDKISIERFKIMERKLYYGIAMPGGIFTIIFGLWLLHLLWQTDMPMTWMHMKLGLVLLLIIYHAYLGMLLHTFKADRNKHSHVFYRLLNEIPIILLAAITILVVVRPFGAIT